MSFATPSGRYALQILAVGWFVVPVSLWPDLTGSILMIGIRGRLFSMGGPCGALRRRRNCPYALRSRLLRFLACSSPHSESSCLALSFSTSP